MAGEELPSQLPKQYPLFLTKLTLWVEAIDTKELCPGNNIVSALFCVSSNARLFSEEIWVLRKYLKTVKEGGPHGSFEK